MGDRTKLPKWAQQEITRLENDLAYAKARLAEGPEDSNTFAEPYSDTPRPLGKNALIEFKIGPEHHQRVNVRVEDDHIHVYGGDSLVLRPVASNVIEVSPKGWR